jgi:transposase
VKLLPFGTRVFITVAPIDLRRGHDGLSAIVRNQWGDALFSGALFVFFGRRFDRCKILFWDRGGLVLYYKRLEQGRFKPPIKTADGLAVEVDSTTLAMVLDGINVRAVARPSAWTPCFKKRYERGSTIVAIGDQS